MPAHRPHFETLLTDDYLREVGRVIAQWAYFEVDFDSCLLALMLHPEAKKLTAVVPRSFVKRAILFRDAARAGFAHHPPTMDLHIKIADDSMRLRNIRDFVAHGRWVPKMRGRGRRRIQASTMIAELVQRGDWGTVQSQPLSLRGMTKTAREIGELSARLFCLWCSPWGHWTVPPEVESEIQAFRRNNFPKLPKIDMSALLPQSPRE